MPQEGLPLLLKGQSGSISCWRIEDPADFSFVEFTIEGDMNAATRPAIGIGWPQVAQI
jgi:hypothetical protein